jgi:hypothetical protein
MSQTQEKFIYSEVIKMTLTAAFATRGGRKIYATEKENIRKNIKKEIESKLVDMSKEYLDPISEKEQEKRHEENIIELSNSISEKYGTYLEGNRFRIGIAQKALNLFLKYLWCLGKIHEPPHFPIDFIMLGKIPDCSEFQWTKLDSIDDYRDIIKKQERLQVNKLYQLGNCMNIVANKSFHLTTDASAEFRR